MSEPESGSSHSGTPPVPEEGETYERPKTPGAEPESHLQASESEEEEDEGGGGAPPPPPPYHAKHKEVYITYHFEFTLRSLLESMEPKMPRPGMEPSKIDQTPLTAHLSEAALRSTFGDDAHYICPEHVEITSTMNDSRWMFMGKAIWLPPACHTMVATNYGHTGHFVVLPSTNPVTPSPGTLLSQDGDQIEYEYLLGETRASLEKKCVRKSEIGVHIRHNKLVDILGLASGGEPTVEVTVTEYDEHYVPLIDKHLEMLKAQIVDLNSTGLAVQLMPCVAEARNDQAAAIRAMAAKLDPKDAEYEMKQVHTIVATFCLKVITYGKN